MRLARLGAFVLLAGCQSGTLAPGPPAASFQAGAVRRDATNDERGGHLYVSVSTATHYPSVERFRLVGGVPETAPDRVYEGYGGLVAVSGNGTLYVSGGLDDFVVYAFGPHGKKPIRQFKIPGPGRCGISSGETAEVSAIAADANGYLFAAIDTYAELRPHLSRGLASRQAGGVPCNGVAVFAPDANGKAKPVQNVALPRGSTITGVAVDRQDNLYVADLTDKVVEYANAVNDPKKTRTFHTERPAHVSSVATDAAGDIFISNINYGYQTGWIDRYAPGAKAHGPPTSQILLQGSSLHVLVSIAVRKRALYAADSFQSVDLYHARKNGGQSPFYSLPASDVSSVAAGP